MFIQIKFLILKTKIKAKDLITQLLQVKIQRRMTVDQALGHIWFTGVCSILFLNFFFKYNFNLI